MDQIGKRESLTIQARTSDSVPRHEWWMESLKEWTLFYLAHLQVIGVPDQRLGEEICAWIKWDIPFFHIMTLEFALIPSVEGYGKKWCFPTRWSKGKVKPVQLKGWLITLRAYLHGVGGPQVGEVTCGGSLHLSCKLDQIYFSKMRVYMDRRVIPPKRVTSPTWGPPPPCKQALRI